MKNPYNTELKFTPLEFETRSECHNCQCRYQLKFTPLEFETPKLKTYSRPTPKLKFTPLEFETQDLHKELTGKELGLKFTPLEFETIVVTFQSVKHQS